MESLVALGLAANAVQFIDFTARVITQTHRIYRNKPQSRTYQEIEDLHQLSLRIIEYSLPIEVEDSIRQVLDERALQKQSTENHSAAKSSGRNPLTKVVHSFKSLHATPENLNDSQDQLDRSMVTRLRACDKQIIRICCRCEEISLELQSTVRRLQSSQHSVWNSFAAALRTVWGEEKIQSLRDQLDEHRQHLTFLLVSSVR